MRSVHSPLHQVTRVAVFGHVGQDNLGDEAAFSAVLQAVKDRLPSADIIGISVDPVDTAARYGILAYPIWSHQLSTHRDDGKRSTEPGADPGLKASVVKTLKAMIRQIAVINCFVRTALKFARLLPAVGREVRHGLVVHRILRDVQLLAIAGSQHLNDYVLGPWNFPYTMWKWTILARLSGVKVAYINVGAGPIRTKLGKFFIKGALRLAHYHSYRDVSSIHCIEQLGIPCGSVPVPDLVFTLPLPSCRPVVGCASIVVGINPIPFNSADYWVGASREGYERYVRLLASFSEWLLGRGLKVMFFPTQLTLDPQVIRDIRSHINEAAYGQGAVTEASIKTVEDLGSAIGAMDFVVASRFHGLVFSMKLQKPSLGIAYAEKTHDLMRSMGQGRYAIDILEVNLPILQQNFLEMESRQNEIKSELGKRAALHACSAKERFEPVFELLRSARAQRS